MMDVITLLIHVEVKTMLVKGAPVAPFTNMV